MVIVSHSPALPVPELIEAASDAFVLVDGDGRITMVNTQTERLFGYRREEMIGNPIEMLVPEEGRVVHPFERERYQQHPYRTAHDRVLAARRRDGSVFPAEISLSPVSTDGGTLVAAAVRDVTERRAADEERAWLAAIVASSTDAIMGTDRDGIVTSWNAAAERLYGYSAAEMVGRPYFTLVPEAGQQAERSLLAQTTHGERVARIRTRRLHKDGRLITVSLSLSPVLAGDQVVGASSVSRDLSEQELAEAKFQGLLEAAPDAIVGVGTDGVIVLANARCEQLFGYRREELIGQPVEMLVPDAVRGHHTQLRDRYMEDPKPRPMGQGASQLSARRKDGTEFPADISLSSLRTEEGLIVLASARDVTDRLRAAEERERLKARAERERLEAQLQQSQRLESLGQLAGGVAHDFNNLLAVILNYSAFVEEEIKAAIDAGEGARWEPAFRDIGQIQRAAQRASALTHQLLAFGRREVVQPRVLDLNEVVRSIEDLLRRTIGEHVRLVVSPWPGLWPVFADPGQLEQVLMNLAVNAKHAMPGGGTLSIETENVTIGDDYVGQNPGMKPGRHVRLRVGDTGVGMPPEVLARVFEPFFTTKPKGEGSGLGLATVYGIITQAGGHVHIYSEPGLGTTFTILLPASERPIEAEGRRIGPRRAGSGETVLVVEDEDAMREVTRRILVRNGYHVITAASGEEAVRVAARPGAALDLLVTDVVMPRMLGKEVAGRINALRPNTRVLFMSGYARPVLADHGTLEPGVTLISKPFSEEELLVAVRQVLDRPPGAHPDTLSEQTDW